MSGKRSCVRTKPFIRTEPCIRTKPCIGGRNQPEATRESVRRSTVPRLRCPVSAGDSSPRDHDSGRVAVRLGGRRVPTPESIDLNAVIFPTVATPASASSVKPGAESTNTVSASPSSNVLPVPLELQLARDLNTSPIRTLTRAWARQPCDASRDGRTASPIEAADVKTMSQSPAPNRGPLRERGGPSQSRLGRRALSFGRPPASRHPACTRRCGTPAATGGR